MVGENGDTPPKRSNSPSIDEKFTNSIASTSNDTTKKKSPSPSSSSASSSESSTPLGQLRKESRRKRTSHLSSSSPSATLPPPNDSPTKEDTTSSSQSSSSTGEESVTEFPVGLLVAYQRIDGHWYLYRIENYVEKDIATIVHGKSGDVVIVPVQLLLPTHLEGNEITVGSKVRAPHPDHEAMFIAATVDSIIEEDECKKVVVTYDSNKCVGKKKMSEVRVRVKMSEELVISETFFNEVRAECDLCEVSIPQQIQKQSYQYTFSKCVQCKEITIHHELCMKKYINLNEEINIDIGSIKKNYKVLNNYQCRNCRSNCFICGQKHTFKGRKKTMFLYKCPSCMQIPKSECFVMGSSGRGNNRTGCALMLDSISLNELRLCSMKCRPCQYAAGRKYKCEKAYDDNMERDMEEKVTKTIHDNLLCIYRDDKTPLNVDECKKAIKQNFTHLCEKEHNLFNVSIPSNKTVYDFHLTSSSFLKIFEEDVIIDEIMMSFIVQCINGFNYSSILKNRADKECTKCFMQFGKPIDDEKFNPCCNENFLQDLLNSRQSVIKIDAIYKKQILKWNTDLLQQFITDRKYCNLQNMNPQEKRLLDEEENGWEYIIPVVDETSHWSIIRVTMPNDTYDNGMVKIVDKSPLKGNESTSIGFATMWYAKLFGLLWHSKQIASNEDLLTYVNDMDAVDFTLDSVTEEEEMSLTTSFDHYGYIKLKSKIDIDPQICDGYNTLLEIISYFHSGHFQRWFVPRGLAVNKKKKEKIRRGIYTLVMDLYELWNASNPYLYNPEEKGCDDDENLWKEVTKQVCNEEINISDIWDVMESKCNDVKAKLPPKVGKLVDMNDDYRSESFRNNVNCESETLTLFMCKHKRSKLIDKNIINYSNQNNNDFLEEIAQLIEHCFKLRKVKRKRSNKRYEHEGFQYLRIHAKNCMKTCTTYFLVDHMDILQYVNDGVTVEEYESDKSTNGKEKILHDVDIYAALIIEKDVTVKNESHAIIHYLCVKSGYEGLGYATTLLHYAFQDKDISQKTVHMVTNLPQCFLKTKYESEIPEVLVKLKNRSKDTNFYEANNLIDRQQTSICSDLVYPCATIAVGKGRSFKNLHLTQTSVSSSVYSIDNFTKYSIASSKNGEIFAKNINFGWMAIPDNEVIPMFGEEKVTLARKYVGREIHLKDFGSVPAVQKSCVEKRDIGKIEKVPSKYLQSYYGHEYNGCVWLSACRILYHIHRSQGELLVNQYQTSPMSFEMLRVFPDGKNKDNSLYGKLTLVNGCLYRVQHVKFDQDHETLTNHILNTRKGGYFITVLCDNYNGTTHAVGINCYSREIYDPMESNTLTLNKVSLSNACGQNRCFKRIAVAGELVRYLKNWHGRRKKAKCNINMKEETVSKKSPDVLPVKYLQKTYGEEYNGSVWLSLCRILYYVDREQGELLVNEYHKAPNLFDRMKIYPATNQKENNLVHRIRFLQGCHYCASVVNVKGGNNMLTNFILKKKNFGYFILVLCDDKQDCRNAVGINLYQRELYDPKEANIQSLNADSLSNACGVGRSFLRVAAACQVHVIDKKRKR